MKPQFIKTPHLRSFPAPLVSAHHSGERMLPPDSRVGATLRGRHINRFDNFFVGTHPCVRPTKDRHMGLSLHFDALK